MKKMYSYFGRMCWLFRRPERPSGTSCRYPLRDLGCQGAEHLDAHRGWLVLCSSTRTAPDPCRSPLPRWLRADPDERRGFYSAEFNSASFASTAAARGGVRIHGRIHKWARRSERGLPGRVVTTDPLLMGHPSGSECPPLAVW